MCILILHYTSAGLAIIPLKRLHPSHIFGQLIDRPVDELPKNVAIDLYTAYTDGNGNFGLTTSTNYHGKIVLSGKDDNGTIEYGGGGYRSNMQKSVGIHAWRRQE